jgi:two-component system response regulator HydG
MKPSIDIQYKTSAKEIIIKALKQSNGVKQKAAELLKIDRKTLYRKMKMYNINM